MITYNPELFVRNVKGGHWPSQGPQLPAGEPAPTSRSKWVGEPDYHWPGHWQTKETKEKGENTKYKKNS